MSSNIVRVSLRIGDPTEIFQAVHSHMAHVDSILISGSSLLRDPELVSDLDVIVLTSQIPAESILDEILPGKHRPINLTVYNSQYFEAVSLDNSLFLYNLREIRKVINGAILYDPRLIARRLVDRLAATNVDKQLLLPLWARVQDYFGRMTKTPLYTLNFHEMIECLFFLFFHYRLHIRYSKHKYLLQDADALGVPCITHLANTIAAESIASTPVSRMIEIAEALARALQGSVLSPISSIALDAQLLLHKQRHLDAVFPLRYSSLKALRTVETKDAESAGCHRIFECRSMLEELLMIGRPISQELHQALDLSIRIMHSFLIHH